MLISPEYLEQQRLCHADPNYGIASETYGAEVSHLINKFGFTELLDYGAGKCRLFQVLKTDHDLDLQAYDPAIPELSGRPEPSEFVTCIDVLEHIEPDCIDAVLDDIAALTKKVAFLTVCTLPAFRTLADGRNAHLILESPEWWLEKFMKRMSLHAFQRHNKGFWVLLKSFC